MNLYNQLPSLIVMLISTPVLAVALFMLREQRILQTAIKTFRTNAGDAEDDDRLGLANTVKAWTAVRLPLPRKLALIKDGVLPEDARKA